jgi:hypothetical protein
VRDIRFAERRLAGVRLVFWAAALVAATPQAGPADDANDARKAANNIKEVAGSAEFLRLLPKRFAFLQNVDPARREVSLLIEGETLRKTWPLTPDAEVKFHGWWGRLDQFHLHDRVWVWFKTDRRQQPAAVAMLADELSEQDIHGRVLAVLARQDRNVTLKVGDQENRRKLKTTAATSVYCGKARASLNSLQVGEAVYVQSSGDEARLILDRPAFDLLRAEQKAALRKRWLDQGLPGTVSFLHIFSGEMDLLLDHEAMRWARSLKLGDKVTLQATPPIPAVVKSVQPWRERTQLRLVVNGVDQADLTAGQRLYLHMNAPPAEVENALLPPDIGLSRTRTERIEWFLASIYCPCGIAGDTCTGHFYTLASCNPNGCGMPRAMRQQIAQKIDRGLSDQQIFEALLKEQGPHLLHPHLMP